MELSEFIIDAMKHIDCELEKINPESINRSKVRSKSNVLIVSQANELILLNQNERKRAIDSIYHKCLTNELFKK